MMTLSNRFVFGKEDESVASENGPVEQDVDSDSYTGDDLVDRLRLDDVSQWISCIVIVNFDAELGQRTSCLLHLFLSSVACFFFLI
jgi:hypothetical protein